MGIRIYVYGVLIVFYAGSSHFVRNFQTVLNTPIDGADEVAAEQPAPEPKV